MAAPRAIKAGYAGQVPPLCEPELFYQVYAALVAVKYYGQHAMVAVALAYLQATGQQAAAYALPLPVAGYTVAHLHTTLQGFAPRSVRAYAQVALHQAVFFVNNYRVGFV